MTPQPKKTARWQNLAQGRCPFCENSQMHREEKWYVCDKCDYCITPKAALQFITDPNSKTRKHMSPADVRRFNTMLTA